MYERLFGPLTPFIKTAAPQVQDFNCTNCGAGTTEILLTIFVAAMAAGTLLAAFLTIRYAKKSFDRAYSGITEEAKVELYDGGDHTLEPLRNSQHTTDASGVITVQERRIDVTLTAKVINRGGRYVSIHDMSCMCSLRPSRPFTSCPTHTRCEHG